MKHYLAISILRKAAFEIAAEVLENVAEEKAIKDGDEVSKLANQILFGGLLGQAKQEKEEEFLALIEAIKVLKEVK